MAYTLQFVRKHTSSVYTSEIISLRYEKERYTPYTRITGTAILDDDVTDVIQIMLRSTKLLHHGHAERVEWQKKNGRFVVSFSSLGFTSSLGLNQLTPGIHSNTTLESLMTDEIALPHVTYEEMSNPINYVYIKENDTMWDAVVAFTRKYNGGYPYISGANTVRLTRDTSLSAVTIPSNKIISIARGQNKSRFMTHIHMKDIEGTYNTYNLTDYSLIEEGIVRHKHISFDRQWLSNPDEAMQSRMDYACRGGHYIKVCYLGNNGEDIRQKATLSSSGLSVTNREISRMEVEVSNGIEKTTLWFYTDKYTP